MVVPPRTVLAGNPAREVKQVSDAMLQWKTDGTRLYQGLPRRLHGSLRPVEPLRQVPPDRPEQQASYQTWHETRQAAPADGE
jgi:hypothetical protein